MVGQVEPLKSDAQVLQHNVFHNTVAVFPSVQSNISGWPIRVSFQSIRVTAAGSENFLVPVIK